MRTSPRFARTSPRITAHVVAAIVAALAVSGPTRPAPASSVPEPVTGHQAFQASFMQAHQALEERRARAAVEHARQALRAAVGDDVLDARLALAEALEAAEEPEEAADVWMDALQGYAILFRGPLRDQVLARLEQLQPFMDARTDRGREQLLRYSGLLIRFGRAQQAVAILSRPSLLESPHGTQVAAQLAAALDRLGRHDARLALVRRALDRAGQRPPQSPQEREAILRLRLALADEQVRQGQEEAAADSLEQLIEEARGTEPAGDALLELVRLRLEKRDLRGAREYLARHESATRATSGRDEALRALLAWSYPHDRETAGWALDRLGEQAPQDATYLFWRAKWMQAAPSPERDPGATLASTLRRLVRLHPLSYQALLAAERWEPAAAELSGVLGPPGGPAVSAAAAPSDSSLEALDAAYHRGLKREATLDLRYLVHSRPTVARLAALARWEIELGWLRPAMDHLAQLLRVAPVHYQERWVLEGMFPRPYRALVEQVASQEGVDPLWLFAIMREESAFEPQALSVADAYGLMQILLPTAAEVAASRRFEPPDPAGLFVPETNVRLAGAYAAELYRRFGDVRLASAAYHAGPGRVSGWLQALGASDDVDLFVERIPFEQTRTYVQKVYRSYLMYQRLYASRR
ncbi:MAG: lytic transglycosylase domain-containing protein [Limnochordaceae bacterium]|nr:lytic transglycosylase domain-containing protein [Limnochordaceae bacterium]